MDRDRAHIGKRRPGPPPTGGRAIGVVVGLALTAAVAAGCASGGDTTVAGPASSSAPAPAAPGITQGRGGVGAMDGGSAPGGALGRVAASATPQYLAEAASRTSEVSSGAFTLGVGLSGGEGLLDGDLLQVEGVFDTSANRARMTLDGGVLFGSTRLVTAGDTTYVSTDGLGSLLTAGRTVPTPWISFASAGSDASSGIVPFVGTGGARSFLAALRGAGGQVTEVGTDTIDGVAVTRYQGTIDPAAAKTATGDAPGGLAELGSTPFPVQAWIDEQGIVRRLELQPSLDAAAGLRALGALGGGGGLTITVELRDLGAPVVIDVPPADQVTEVDPSSLSRVDPGAAGLGGLGGLGAGGGDLGGLGGLGGG